MGKATPMTNQISPKMERLDHLDAVRGLCVLLIVIEHHLLDADFVVRYLCSFSLPPFFLISGYLYAHKKEWERPFKAIAAKNIRRLMYPFVTFSIINLIWHLLYYKVVFRTTVPDSVTLPELLLYSVTTYGYNALWYLPAMLFGTLLFFAIRKQKHHRLIWAVSAVLIIVLYILFDKKLSGHGIFSYIYCYLFRSTMAMIFIYAGHLLYELLPRIRGKRETFVLTVSALLSGGIMLLYLFAPAHFPIVNLSAHRLGNPYFYYLSAIAPAMVMFLLCRRFAKPKGLLAFFGRNSLIIMATHMDILVRIAWYIVAKLQLNFGETVNSLIVIALELAMVPVIVPVIHRFFPFILKFPQKTATH